MTDMHTRKYSLHAVHRVRTLPIRDSGSRRGREGRRGDERRGTLRLCVPGRETGKTSGEDPLLFHSRVCRSFETTQTSTRDQGCFDLSLVVALKTAPCVSSVPAVHGGHPENCSLRFQCSHRPRRSPSGALRSMCLAVGLRRVRRRRSHERLSHLTSILMEETCAYAVMSKSASPGAAGMRCSRIRAEPTAHDSRTRPRM
jgi:hypothetical protein